MRLAAAQTVNTHAHTHMHTHAAALLTHAHTQPRVDSKQWVYSVHPYSLRLLCNLHADINNDYDSPTADVCIQCMYPVSSGCMWYNTR